MCMIEQLIRASFAHTLLFCVLCVCFFFSFEKLNLIRNLATVHHSSLKTFHSPRVCCASLPRHHYTSMYVMLLLSLLWLWAFCFVFFSFISFHFVNVETSKRRKMRNWKKKNGECIWKWKKKSLGSVDRLRRRNRRLQFYLEMMNWRWWNEKCTLCWLLCRLNALNRNTMNWIEFLSVECFKLFGMR